MQSREKVPLADVGRRGRLELTFTPRGSRTVIGDAYVEVPFKITRLVESSYDGIAHLILMQCSAGLFGGDAAECRVHVEAGARVLITQQSATKVHPSQGRAAIQRSYFRVDAGGELHVHLEPTIPFAGARLIQSTQIDVAPGARLTFWEGLMAGRSGRGESWQFDEISSETTLRRDPCILYLDRFSLNPNLQVNQKWRMGDSKYLATALYFDEAAPDIANRLHELMPAAGVDSPARGLTVVRFVASDGPDFYSHQDRFLAISCPTSRL